MKYEVGRYYKVPCVYATYLHYYRPKWWPVIGPIHEDREHIGVEFDHFHVDYRFLPKSQQERVLNGMSKMFDAPIAAYQIVKPGTRKSYFDHETGVNLKDLNRIAMNDLKPNDLRWYQVRKKKCCLSQCEPYPATKAPWIKDLEQAYRHTNAKRPDGSLVCPHRGTPLDSLGTHDGCVECPLHGLRWNPDTGSLVPWEKR